MTKKTKRISNGVTKFLTAESVAPGHPDKLADQIADAILDAILEKDPYSRVACEIFVGIGYVIVGGEITTRAKIDVKNIARQTIKDIGYNKPEYGFDYNSLSIFDTVNRQSPDIAKGVRKTGTKKQGSGDQGISIGYACSETPELMPLAMSLAHKLAMKLTEARRKRILPYLRPDGKSQVTLEYQEEKPKRLDSVVIAAQHDPDVSLKRIKKDIIEKVIRPVCQKYLDRKTKFYINNTGRFVIGGPISDTGMTGRKNVVDAYGPQIPIGGGSFSGKDPTKVDRSAAYMARYIAKNIVAAKLAEKCQVEISFVIGGTKPLSIHINTFGTADLPEERIIKIIPRVFDLTPGGMIKTLNLLKPIYRKTACYGHFGREEAGFSWEKKDKIKEILKFL